MIKTAAEHAYYMGKVAAYNDVGFPAEFIVEVLHQEGLSKHAAHELVKEAIWGAIGGGIARAGTGLARVGAGAIKAAPGAAQGAATGMKAGLGRLGVRAGSSLARAGESFAAAPGAAAWQGVKNFGKGMMGGGTGGTVGGALGTGAMGYGIYSGVKSMFGNNDQQQQQPQYQQ